jgi:large subunit ribosomal protein L25
MEFEKLTAQVRTGRRKGTARRLRRDGFIPAICYGPEAKPVALSVDPKALSEALSGPLGKNTVMELTIEGDGAPDASILVMLQDHQYHAIYRSVLHADFLRVSMDRDVSVQVPLVLEGRSQGEQIGGILAQVFRTLPVRCKPNMVPEAIRLDISPLNMGDLRKISDLEIPEGVVIELEPNRTVVSVTSPTEVKEVEADEDGEAAADTPAADEA